MDGRLKCSVEGLVFFQDGLIDLMICGSVGGDVVVFDLVTMVSRKHCLYAITKCID